MAQAQLQQPVKTGTSLDLIPANTSFYSGFFRIQEQWQRLSKTNAWKKLLNMGSVQLGLGQLKAFMNQPGGPFEEYNQLMKDPDNQQLQELLLDMASNEVFIWGDKQASKSVSLLIEVSNSMRYTPMMIGILAGINNQAPPDPEKAMAIAVLETLNQRMHDVQIPNIMIGFKLSKPELSDKQLQRLELIVTRLLAQAPPLVEKFKRTKLGDGTYLVFDLDGEIVPWDEIPWDEIEEEAGQYDKLRNKLRQLKLNISIGVQNGYAIVSIGNSNEHLTKLGKQPLLKNSKSFAVMEPFMGQPLTSTHYLDETIRGALTTQKKDIQDLAKQFENLLDLAELDENLNNRIISDLGKLSDDLLSIIPDVGEYLSWNFMTEQGNEGYVWDWNQNLSMDTSKPLNLLNSLGSNPLAAAVTRAQYRPQDYDLFVKWIKIGYGYVEDFALPQLGANEVEQFNQVMDRVIPIAQKFDGIMRQYLLPATKDSQSAFVIDNQTTSKQLFKEMPASSKPLPVPELAMVLGVSDAEKLQTGFVEIKKIADDIVTMIRDFEPESIPADYKIPDPKQRALGGGNVWWYDLPKDVADELQIDKQLLPHVGLNKDVALFSTSPGLTGRIFAGKAIETGEFLNKVRNQPLGALTYVNVNGICNMFSAWLEYGATLGIEQSEDTVEKMIFSFVQTDGKTILEVLGCVKSYSSYTVTKDKALVTHSQWLYQDLK